MKATVKIVATTFATIALAFGGLGWLLSHPGWGLFVAIGMLAVLLK